MSGVIIYPPKVKLKTKSMNSHLKEYKQNIKKEKRAMENVLEETIFLSGEAWDSARSYIRDIQMPLLDTTMLWVDIQTEENKKYHNAALRLPFVNCLNQDELERQLADWESKLERERNRDEPSDTKIARYRLMISLINIKLDAIERFITNTTELYERSAEIQGILNRADTEINKVSYDQNTNSLNFTEVDRTWVMEFERIRDFEALKAKGLTEEQIKEGENNGFTFAEILAIWEEMQGRDITRVDIENINQNKFSFGDIIQIWKGAETEDDRILVTGLIKGDYITAFTANPTQINLETKLFFSEYTLQISMKETGAENELQEMMNAMLEANRKEFYGINAGYGGSNIHSMKYLEMLHSSTMTLLDVESILFLYPECLSEEKKEELLKRNEKQMALVTMSRSAYEILYKARGGGSLLRNSAVELSEIIMNDLTYHGGAGSYSYELSYKGVEQFYTNAGPGQPKKIDAVVPVVTGILKTPSELDGQIYLEARAELEASRNAAGGKMLSDILAGGAVLTLKSVNPLAGAAAQMIYSTLQGEYSTAVSASYTGLKTDDIKDPIKRALENVSETKIDSIMGAVSTETAVVGIRAWISYKQKYSSLSNEIERADWEQKMSWFGQGGMYTINGEDGGQVIVTGIYNPQILERIGIWESQGLEKLVEEVTGEKLFDDEGEGEPPEKVKFINSITETEKIIWTGGGVMEMDMEEFQSAVNGLIKKYNLTNKKVSLDIKSLITQTKRRE